MRQPVQQDPSENRTKQAYERVFRTADGNRVLRDLAAFSGMASAPHADSELIDPLALAATAGKQRMVLRILAMAGIGQLELIASVLLDKADPIQDRADTTRPRGDDNEE